MTERIRLVPFDRVYLDLSDRWLSDPEIKSMTMTPDFTVEDQLRFFDSLPTRKDYLIWGLEHAGAPIGAAGLKNLRSEAAEYWGYIGERSLWGQGLGGEVIAAIEAKAREMALAQLSLKVDKGNLRALRLYERLGFTHDHTQNGINYMTKCIV